MNLRFRLSYCSYIYLFTLCIGKTIKCLVIGILVLLSLFIFKINLSVSLRIFMLTLSVFYMNNLKLIVQKLERKISIFPGS